MIAETPIIQLTRIKKEFPSPNGLSKNEVLSDVSLSVYPGDSIAVFGPSGSGKSTLLNIMGTLDHPTSGEVLFTGENLNEFSDEKLSFLRNRKIGFVFQLHHLLPQLTVLENILLPVLPFPKETMGKDHERAVSLLEYTGLSDRSNHKPSQLSGGELLRTAVCRALINEPALLLADEPTGSLDGKTSEDLGNLLLKLNHENGLTLVIVTHSQKLAGMMSKQFELKDGCLTEK